MAWDDEPKPDVSDLMKAIGGYLDARDAVAADRKRIDEANGYRYDPYLADSLSKAISDVEGKLNSIIDQRVEARLKELGVSVEAADTPIGSI